MQDVVFGVSPGLFLASFLSNRVDVPVLALVTGVSGAGKTTWCQGLAGLAQARGLRLAGLLSPAIFENNLKIGIGLLDLSSSERRRLATLRAPGLPSDALSTRQWSLDAETIAWGNMLLSQTGECDVLIVDELGPLELERGLGLQAGLTRLDARQYRLACAVVRPSLLAVAQARWPGCGVVRLNDPGS